MITFLSGGTGTPKLLRGMRSLLPDREISVVVNTAEDLWISGNHLSPDLDTVMYLFAGLADTATWWGIAGDSFATHDALVAWGGEEPLKIGDREREFVREFIKQELMEGISPDQAASGPAPSRTIEAPPPPSELSD